MFRRRPGPPRNIDLRKGRGPEARDIVSSSFLINKKKYPPPCRQALCGAIRAVGSASSSLSFTRVTFQFQVEVGVGFSRFWGPVLPGPKSDIFLRKMQRVICFYAKMSKVTYF